MLNFIPMLLNALRGFLTNAVSGIRSTMNSASGNITKQMSNGSASPTAQPPNMDTKVEIKGVDEVLARLKKIEKEIKQGLAPITISHSSALCYDLIRNTYPLVNKGLGTGGGGSAKMVGERNFKAEVNKVFQPIDRIPFATLVARQDWAGIQEMDWKPRVPSIIKMIEEHKTVSLLRVFGDKTNAQVPITEVANFDDHQRGRDSKGRVNSTFYVRNKQSIELYYQKFKQRVGIMASGWWVCAQRLGRPADGNSAVDGFVKKNYGTGRATVSRQDGDTKVAISNTLGDHNGMVSSIGGIADAVRKRRAKMELAVDRLTKQVIKNNPIQ